MSLTVTVPERGEAKVDRSVWYSLAREAAFWDLVEAGIVEARQLRGGGARLIGSRYVGKALCGDIVLECQEKVPGALLAMLETGLGDFVTLPSPAPITELGNTVRLIVRAFLAEVRRYVAGGRNWEYRSRREVSSLVGGKIHMPTTVSLRARGMRHLVAFDRPDINHCIDINKLVAAALWEIEVLGRLVVLAESDLSLARQMSLFFEDCHDVSAGSLLLDAGIIGRQLEDARNVNHRAMISLAGLILSHAALEPAAPLPGAAPISWFLNLETLFEDAVRHSLVSAVGPDGRVTKGSAHGRRVFPQTGGLRADPDLVVDLGGGRRVIGDVKYKVWSQTSAPADLYQLLTHANAFDAETAFLLYPSDTFDEVDLGRAITGAHVRLFAVDVRALGDGLRLILRRLTSEVAS
jgi:5-methylcytosine-specific restriction endonuclease McrBC regulatory subunit McrC